MARKPENTKRINCSVLAEAYAVLRQNAESLGYIGGNGIKWREYLGAIAAQIVESKIKLPKFKK